MEVAKLASQGLSYKEIANRVHLTADGVKYRLGTVYEKLSLSSKKELKELKDYFDAIK